MTRGRVAAVALALVVTTALPSVARGGSDLTVGDEPLTREQRRVRHEQRAVAAERAGDRARAAREWAHTCGNALFSRYDYNDPSCLRALELAAAIGDGDAAATVHTARAGLVAWSMDWDASEALARQALAVATTPSDQLAGDGARYAHMMLGFIAAERGRFDEATAELERARRDAAVVGDVEVEAETLAFRCRLQAVLGELEAAQASCDRALRLATDVGSGLEEFVAVWQTGNLALDRGDLALAERHYRRYLELGLAGGGGLVVDVGRVNLATVLVRRGQLDEAAALVRRLDDDVAAGRSPASYRFGNASARAELLAARGDLEGAAEAWRLAAANPIHWFALGAMIERGRVLSRLGDLAGARATYDEALRAIEAERTAVTGEQRRARYLTRHAAVYAELVGVIWAQQGEAGAEQALAVAEAGRARALLDALRAADQADATATPLEPSAIRARLAPGETLLVYVIADAQAFGLAVTRDAVRFRPLPGAGDAAALAERVTFFHQLVREAKTVAALAPAGSALYRDLVAPLVGDAPPATLIIVPHGPLHGLPFDALITADGAPLVERTVVTWVPSASILGAQVRAAPPAGFAPRPTLLAVADPADRTDLGALPASRDEVAAARDAVAGPATLLEGAAATEAAVKRLLPGHAIAHFATHAVIDEAVPLRSALVLAPGGGDDGRLRAEEIYHARLDAELVVLSACSTGRGALVAGEGSMSLARAFLRAGAGALVATHWDIDDRRAATLMATFYRRLDRDTPVPLALAQAKRELARRGAPPRIWAGFLAIAPPGATVAMPPRPARASAGAATWLVPGLALGAVLAGLALTVRRRARRPRAAG